MKIQCIHDQGSGALNEDALLVEKNLFGVFDGATSINKYISEEGKTGGLLAAEIARDAFTEKQQTLAAAAHHANAQISRAMKVAGIDLSKGANLWRAAAAVIKLKDNSFEWLVIADCVILTIDHNGVGKEVVPFQDHDKEVLMKWKKLAEQKIMNIREKMADELFKLRDESHPPYGVLNGERRMNPLFKVGEQTLERVKHILVFTDGLFLPSENPSEPPDFQHLASLYLQGGLEKVRATVRDLEESDPNCWKYPRYKPHDDIAAIAITF